MFHFQVIRYVDTQRVYTAAADSFLYFYQISSDGMLTTRP